MGKVNNPITNTDGSTYQAVPANATTTLGATGAIGDFLGRVIVTAATAATATVSIKDGADTAINILPNSPGGGIGVYSIQLGIFSRTGAWQIVAGAGSTVLAIGSFT